MLVCSGSLLRCGNADLLRVSESGELGETRKSVAIDVNMVAKLNTIFNSIEGACSRGVTNE